LFDRLAFRLAGDRCVRLPALEKLEVEPGLAIELALVAWKELGLEWGHLPAELPLQLSRVRDDGAYVWSPLWALSGQPTENGKDRANCCSACQPRTR